MLPKGIFPFEVRPACRANGWGRSKSGLYALLLGMPIIIPVSIVGAEQRDLTFSDAPKSLNWQNDRNRLLAMPDQELIGLLERVSEEQFKQISDLAPERMLTVPVRLFLRGLFPQGATAADAGKLIEVTVSQLLYERSREGIEHFQTDIGAEPTGDLTLGEFSELMRRFNRQRDTPVYASDQARLFILNDIGLASVAGTWVSQSEDAENSVNTTKITCDRSRNECLRVIAYVDVPEINSSELSKYFLRITSDIYSVVSWEPTEIVAQGSKCGTTLLTLKLRPNEVFEVAGGNGSCKAGVARLVSGFEFSEDFWRKRLETTCAYLSSRTSKELTDAMGELPCQRPPVKKFVPDIKFVPDDNHAKVKGE